MYAGLYWKLKTNMGYYKYRTSNKTEGDVIGAILSSNTTQKIGDEIVAPLKYNGPIKLKDIPCKGNLKIIDNYSENGRQSVFNYIVEGDKIYYSKKGLTDNWVDISDNDVARKNLFKFLKDKYDFRGYNSGERELYNSIMEGSFDYNTYHSDMIYDKVMNHLHPAGKNNSSKHSKVVDNTGSVSDKNPIVQPQVDKKPIEKKPVSKLDTQYWQDAGQRYPSPSYVGFTNGPYVNFQADNFGSQIEEDKSSNDSTNIGTPVVENTKITNDLPWYMNINYSPMLPLVSLSLNRAYNFADRKWHEWGGNPRAIWQTVRNGLSRQWDKYSEKSEYIPSFNEQNFAIDGDYGIIPGSFVGDTIKVNNRRYITPENLDMTEYIFGHRNRNDYSTIISEAAPITAFYPFVPYGQHKENSGTFIGYDTNGRLKAGDISEFGEGDYLSKTYANKVYKFIKDKNGNFVWQSDSAHGNRNQNVPKVLVEDEKTGQLVERFPVNILSYKSDLQGTTYGNITGGRVLVKVGNEFRLLSGSVSNIEKAFEDMKKRQGVDFGIFYTLDNGSYNRALRTYDGIFTKGDLQAYDRQNIGSSGNFLYIKGTAPNHFAQDTVWTPYIRNEQSESYLKGHPLTNQLEGVLFHHTAFSNDPTMEKVTNHFMKNNSEVSAHVVINKNGDRRIFANPEDVTFHAGESRFNEKMNVNDFMLGIEFQGNTENEPLTNEQIESVVEYLVPLIRKYKIKLENLATHEMVRHAYNQYAKETGLKQAPNKPDITYEQFVRIIDKLKEKVYYKK